MNEGDCTVEEVSLSGYSDVCLVKVNTPDIAINDRHVVNDCKCVIGELKVYRGPKRMDSPVACSNQLIGEVLALSLMRRTRRNEKLLVNHSYRTLMELDWCSLFGILKQKK